MKTHIDNTIEEILKPYDIGWRMSGGLTAVGELEKARLITKLKAESKKYAGEKIKEAFKAGFHSVAELPMSRLVDVDKLAEEFINQSTESEKETA